MSMNLDTIISTVLAHLDWAVISGCLVWLARTRRDHRQCLQQRLLELLEHIDRVRADPNNTQLRLELPRLYTRVWAAKDQYTNWINLSALNIHLHRLVHSNPSNLQASAQLCHVEIYAVFNRLKWYWPLNILWWKLSAKLSQWVK